MMKACNEKKILFITNYPAPYRVEFFNQLGQFTDLTVLFTENAAEQSHRNKTWFNENYYGFKAVFLKETITIKKKRLCWGVLKYLKMPWDCIISGGYADPTQMLAFEWLKAHRVPFYLEMDGGLIKTESYLKYRLKRHFISMPTGWFSSGKATDEYYIHYGARKDGIIPYPFTSMKEADLAEAQRIHTKDRLLLREKLGIQENRVIVSVGRFTYGNGYGKGYDTLLGVAERLGAETGIYIIGDEPTAEFVALKETRQLENVHFVGFKKKDDLLEYYCAADIFVFLTRNDVWGLVVNEAMACGLPVITTNKCGAGLSLVCEGENGYIVPVNDVTATCDRIDLLLKDQDAAEKFGKKSVEIISAYSIENMVTSHINFIKNEE